MIPEFKTILFATDLSEGSGKVLRNAVSLARKFEGKINIVHVLEPIGQTAKAMVDLYVPDEMVEKIKADGMDKVKEEIHKKLLRFCENEVCTMPLEEECIGTTSLLEGDTAQAILKEAEETGADLIMLGTNVHSMVGEIFSGSTAHKVSLKSKVPVMIVPLD